MNENGSRPLMLWILGALFSVVTLGASGGAWVFNNRLTTVETENKASSADEVRTSEEIRRLRDDVCRVEGKVDMLLEDVTHHRQPLTPCPPVP